MNKMYWSLYNMKIMTHLNLAADFCLLYCIIGAISAVGDCNGIGVNCLVTNCLIKSSNVDLNSLSHSNLRRDPCPSWLRSPKLQNAHTFPGLKIKI